MALVLNVNNRLQLRFKIDPDHLIDVLSDNDLIVSHKENNWILLEDLLSVLPNLEFAVCAKIPRDLYNDKGEVVKNIKLVTFAPKEIRVVREAKPSSSSSGH